MKFKIPHTFTIVFFIIVICAILTWFVPGGKFERQILSIDGVEKSVVVQDSYHQVESHPQTWEIFSSFFKGFVKTSNIIVFILMIGGAFWIMNYTKAIDKGILSFLNNIQKLQKYSFFKKIGVNNILMTLIIILFSFFGAVFGMSEETIAFIIIFVPLAISMGYDSITGVLICYVAAHIGFTGAMLNPFTVGIAQGLSGLQPFSGIEYRFFCWIFMTVILIIFTVIYASKVKKNPKKSIMYEADSYWRERENFEKRDNILEKPSIFSWIVFIVLNIIFIYCSITMTYTDIAIGNTTFHVVIFPIIEVLFFVLGIISLRKSITNFILVILLFTVIMLIVGVLGYQWYVMEIATLFFGMGISTGIAYKINFDKIVRLFLEGCKDIMVAALVVGLAGGIFVILEDGKVVDTILYSVSKAMQNSGKVGGVGVMYAIQNLLNIFIPSGSAKAALTMPMMSEFSDLVGISRQLTVLAFQFGDGFTNMITPASGVLLGVLGVAKIPYYKWAKFIFPVIICFIILGFFLLLPPLFILFNGF